jgi:hypothetical protein
VRWLKKAVQSVGRYLTQTKTKWLTVPNAAVVGLRLAVIAGALVRSAMIVNKKKLNRPRPSRENKQKGEVTVNEISG